MSRQRRAKEARADALFAKRIVARGVCQAQGFVTTDGVLECWGPLQCAHIIRRRFKSTALRWDDDNAACLCLRHHIYFTGNREAEDRFHAWLLSPARFESLRARAQLSIYDRADIDEVLATLKAGGGITNRG